MRTPSTSRWRVRSRAYLHDPYTEPVDRPPLIDDVTVAVIGGGFAGLITGARLTQAGIDDFRIIEKGGDFGGTWYWNRYPGAQCDVESYVYLPLLEETSYVPSEKYARAPEILEHCRRIARHFDLYERACLSTEVTAIAWDDDRLRWTITTNRGDRMSARFLVMGNGPLHRPKLPGIPGIAEFEGHSFHTSRWDYSYTGGDSNGGWTAWPTSASASSAPAPPPCRSFRTLPPRPVSCSSSSARPPPSTSGATGRRTPRGPPPSSPDGNGSGWRTSRC